MNEPQESNFYASASLWEGSFACNFDTDLFGKILLKKNIFREALVLQSDLSKTRIHATREKINHI